MIIGSTLMHDGTGTTPYYTPAFPRGGEAAVFSVQASQLYAATTLGLDVTVEHKNEDDTAWGSAGTLATITAVGVTTTNITGLKEMIRLAFTYSSGTGGDFVHVVIPAPAWRPY